MVTSDVARGAWADHATRRLRTSARRLRGVVNRRIHPTPWGDLRSLKPVDTRFGMSRGTPVDRVYVEAFLREHQELVRGHVLEVGDARYSSMFGGGAVTRQSILDVTAENANATIVGDLSKGLPGYDGAFDCLVLTQVLPFIFDVDFAVRTIRRTCAPGGAALVTLPGISQISRYDMDRWGDYWRFTNESATRLFAQAFGGCNVAAVTYGNVLTATALLHGIAAEDLLPDEISHHDPDYQVIIGLVARAEPP